MRYGSDKIFVRINVWCRIYARIFFIIIFIISHPHTILAANPLLILDSRCDVDTLLTDPNADGVFDSAAHHPINILQIELGSWTPNDPAMDLFAGFYDNNGLFARIELVVDGLVNPPGSVDPLAFEPFLYGPHPVYGFIEIDMDLDRDTGGELESPQFRYLGNVARFHGLPSDQRMTDRVALDGTDLDQNFSSPPFVERHGEEFHIAFVGGEFVTSQLTIIEGNEDLIFEDDEVWNIRASWFHRAHGYEIFSLASGGTIAGEYAPMSDIQFRHESELDVTHISLIFPLTNEASAIMRDEDPEPINNNPSDQSSIEEALDDLILSAEVLNMFPTGLAEEELIIRWKDKLADQFLEPFQWRVTAILGSSYVAPDPSGVYFIWNDIYPNVVSGDVDGDGEAAQSDRNMIENFILLNDAADGISDGSVLIPNFADNFNAYDVNYDGVVDSLDFQAIGFLGECNDGNLCTVDSCVDSTGCVYEEIECDSDEVCNPGNGECEIDPGFSAHSLYWAQTIGDQIKQLQLQDVNVTALLQWPRLDDPIDIAIEPVNGKIYWAQSIGNKIKSSDLNGDNVATILRWPQLDHPVGIAIDSIHEKIYWAQTIGDRIRRADLDGENVETILEWPQLDDPIDIDVDPIEGKIYWAQSIGDKIRRCDLDGSNVETILERPVLDNPVSIALDPVGGKIYWAQTTGDKIRRADVNGENVETVLRWPALDQPVSIEIDPFARKIYWSQSIGDKLRRADLSGEHVETLSKWPVMDGVVAIALQQSPPVACPNECNDESSCTTDICIEGVCSHASIECVDSNNTTIDLCNATLGCIHMDVDFDGDSDVDLVDYQKVMNCYSGNGIEQNLKSCLSADIDVDGDVDLEDYKLFKGIYSGPSEN